MVKHNGLPNSPDEDDSVKEGVPSVHVGVGVWADEPPTILLISLLSIDVLLSDRISSCTSDNLENNKDKINVKIKIFI